MHGGGVPSLRLRDDFDWGIPRGSLASRRAQIRAGDPLASNPGSLGGFGLEGTLRPVYGEQS